MYQESMTKEMSSAGVVITGASDGIGKAMAVEFAKMGARIGLIARRKELLEDLADELRKVGALEVRVAAVDVTDHEAQRFALDEMERGFNGITHLVLNAGISGRTVPWEDSWPDVKKCLEVNVMAALNAAEWMKPRMVARKRGTIAGVSSIAGVRGLPDSGAYSSSKAALSIYLESLRVDLAPFGIRVVTVAPGYIRTALTAANKGKMPFLMDVEEAGRIFAEGIRCGKKLVVAPWQYLWLMRLIALLPNWIYDPLVSRFMKKVRG